MDMSIGAMTEQALLSLVQIDGTLDSPDRLADDAILYVSRSTGKDRFGPVMITVEHINKLLFATTGHDIDCLKLQYKFGDERDCICKK